MSDAGGLAGRDQSHGFGPKQNGRHQLQVGAHQQRYSGLAEDVFFKINSRGDLDHGEAIVGQLDHAAFGDVEDLLAASAGHLAGEGDLGDLRDELGNRAVGNDLELAVFDLDVLPPGGEVAGINDLGRPGDDVVEAADACGDMRPGGEVGDVDVAGARHLQKRQHRYIEAAALQQGELISALHQCLRVQRAAEGEAGRREPADRALLDHPGDVLGMALLQEHARDGRGDSEAQVDNGVDLQFGRGPAGDHLLQAELDRFDVVEVA